MRKFGGAHLLCMGLASAILAVQFYPAAAGDASLEDRMERWRAARAGRLQTPLPGTPDTEKPLTRLASTGVSLGAPMMIRIFKAESEFEIWVLKNKVYVPFATYPICYWAGNLGPKLREGDRQTPEGFYTLTENQLHDGARWRRSLDIGYPNVFDRANGRSGSAILVHGGCDSSGCFAMTNSVSAELYDLVSATLRSGTQHIPVHVFPFRMTDANMTAAKDHPWRDFWANLKQGYDSFERTRRPPRVSVCGGETKDRRAQASSMLRSPATMSGPGAAAGGGASACCAGGAHALASSAIGNKKRSFMISLRPLVWTPSAMQVLTRLRR